MERARSRRELGAVLLFALALALPFLGEPWHLDEPFFLAIGRQILRDPLHPLAFSFNWYGRLVPMSAINNTPPVLGYLLAAALALTGGGEAATRLLFLPFDLAGAAALYLIAARFLKRPLWPVLIALACPASVLNMSHLMPEKVMWPLALLSLYALLRGVDGRRRAWFWGSALLLGAALMAKYNALFAALPAAGYCLERGVPRRRILAYLAVAFAPLAAYLLFDRLTRPAALGAAWLVTAETSRMFWASWPHKLRSVLAFTGGCGVVTALWPCLAFPPRGRALPALVGGAALLFVPALDVAPLVRPADRLLGALLACGAAWGLWGLLVEARRQRGWGLWAPWVVGVLVIQTCLYWSVLGRLVLFLLPPLILGTAEHLEGSLAQPRLARLQRASFAGVLLLTAALGWVDYRYAWAQRAVAREVSARFPGRRIWCAAHWGLQYYVERAGGRELDYSRGGWDEVRPGDVVVLSRVNSNVMRPRAPVRANVRTITLDSAVPLRLISGWTGEGGFYANVSGFLPFSLSREPLEEFTVVEVL